MYHAACLNNIENFDRSFFGMAKDEAIHTDPQQKIILELAWRAFENAKIDPFSNKYIRTGVFIGASLNDYSYFLRNKIGLDNVTPYTGLGNSMSAISGRIAYFFNFKRTGIHH